MAFLGAFFNPKASLAGTSEPSQFSRETACRISDELTFKRAGQDIIIQQGFSSSNNVSSTGAAVWEASTALTSYMEILGQEFFKGKTVLEVGAGTGFASIAAVLLGAQSVVVTDGSAGVLELAKRNAQINLTPSQQERLHISELQWQDPVGSHFDSITGGRGFDIVLASDVTYDKSVVPILIDLLKGITKPGGVILLSHTWRSKISLQAFYDTFMVETIKNVPRSVTTCRFGYQETVILRMVRPDIDKMLLLGPDCDCDSDSDSDSDAIIDVSKFGRLDVDVDSESSSCSDSDDESNRAQ